MVVWVQGEVLRNMPQLAGKRQLIMNSIARNLSGKLFLHKRICVHVDIVLFLTAELFD